MRTCQHFQPKENILTAPPSVKPLLVFLWQRSCERFPLLLFLRSVLENVFQAWLVFPEAVTRFEGWSNGLSTWGGTRLSRSPTSTYGLWFLYLKNVNGAPNIRSRDRCEENGNYEVPSDIIMKHHFSSGNVKHN